MLNLDQLKSVHPAYGQWVNRWDYYLRSYQGGEEYRAAGYLRKYLNEDAAPGDQYRLRLMNTPLDNHCRTVVSAYRAFLFRTTPTRVFGNQLENPDVVSFLKDSDLDGRSIDSFIQMVNDYISVYGTMWILVDKPAYQAGSRAEELALGIRPYVAAYAPSAVLDWSYRRDITGRMVLYHVKVVEEDNSDTMVIKCWYPDRIEKYVIEKYGFNASIGSGTAIGTENVVSFDMLKVKTILSAEEIPNPLGMVPFICAIDEMSRTRGIGISDLADVADLQRSIYNKLSELEQGIRISNHPSIVKTVDVQASAGAGSVINMPEDLRGDLKPYLLQPSGSSVDAILSSIRHDVEAIERITHLSAIRAVNGTPMSGVALQTEMQMLNSRLADKAQMLEELENKIWDLFWTWSDITPPEEFKIIYEKSFDLRDKHSDLELLNKALPLVPTNEYQKAVQKQIARLVIDDDKEIDEVLMDIEEHYEESERKEMAAEGESMEEESSETSEMASDDEREYPDGEDIPSDLPEAYGPGTEQENCANCAHYMNGLCERWNNVPVRPTYWCAVWEPKEQ